MEICYDNSQWDPILVCARKIKCSWMHLLKMLLRWINAVWCVKKRHAPWCIHKMQAILSVMIIVNMNVLQFDVCSNCYVLVYWFPTYWEIYEMQYLGYLSVRRYNSINSFSTAHPVVFQIPLFMPHGMCQIHACCSGVLSLHVSHRALELWDTTATKMLIVERGLYLSGAVSSRLIANQRRCSIIAWSYCASTRRL